jgi:hypothetical protein
MSRQGDPPDAKSRSIDLRCEVNCSEGKWHEASSNEKSSKRAAMSRTVNEEWWRDQEDNDGRNRERIDKVVDRIKSQFKREVERAGVSRTSRNEEWGRDQEERAGVSRNKEWGREQEENDGRNRERRDKVVDRIENLKNLTEFSGGNFPNATT